MGVGGGRYRNERRFAKVSTSQIRADYFGFSRDERGEMINSSKEYFKLDLCLYYYITVHVATTERNSHPDIVWGILYIICNSLVHITTLTTPFWAHNVMVPKTSYLILFCFHPPPLNPLPYSSKQRSSSPYPQLLKWGRGQWIVEQVLPLPLSFAQIFNQATISLLFKGTIGSKVLSSHI